MSAATKDLWQVRLPDDRLVRAEAGVIRQQLADGRLPPGTRVRRSRDDEWQPVERVAAFADASPASRNGHPHATIASRLDADQMHLAGLRPLLEELTGALEATFVSRKLRAAALGGLLLGAIASLSQFGWFAPSLTPGLGWLLPVAALLIWSALSAALSKMTFAELSRLRPATWGDAAEGGFGSTVHLFVAQSVVAVPLSAAVVGLRLSPGLAADLGSPAVQAVAVACLAAEVLVWVAFALLLPMPAVLVVEQGNLTQTLGRWLSLVWRKGRRLLLAELLVVAVGLVLSAPLALIVGAVGVRAVPDEAAVTVSVARWVLLGLASSLMLTYVSVANVFAYLAEREQG